MTILSFVSFCRLWLSEAETEKQKGGREIEQILDRASVTSRKTWTMAEDFQLLMSSGFDL